MDWLPDIEMEIPEQVYKLRDYQSSAVEACLNFTKYMDGNGYVVLPTASGKSIVMAALAERLEGRVLLLAHRKELLAQNASKFTEQVGIYSAGLGKRQLDKRITVAGIQSIASVAHELDNIDWIIIDEVHRLPDKEEGQYWDVINHLQARVIGFTATNFRLDGGYLKWGQEIFKMEYQPLIDRGYLCPLINKVPFTLEVEADIRLGDYVLNQLEDELIDPELLQRSVAKIKQYSIDRASVLIFVATIKHGLLVQQVMRDNGLYAQFVTGDTCAEERSQIAEEFKAGEIQYVINCQIWTEGFDAPNIDMIAVLRPTKSKALHEQILGRGVRVAASKTNCLLLDMAGNLQEHGGLGTPYTERIKGMKNKNEGRICPVCETLCKITAIDCPDCHYVFPEAEVRSIKHQYDADTETDTIYQGDALKFFNIKKVMYFPHTSKAGNAGLRIDYIHEGYYGNKTSEYLSPWHESEWVRHKAWKLFRDRGVKLEKPIEEYSINELIELAQSLKQPLSLSVKPQKNNPQYTEIAGYNFDTKEAIIDFELDDSIGF
jgi:DNA repair protein RadD